MANSFRLEKNQKKKIIFALKKKIHITFFLRDETCASQFGMLSLQKQNKKTKVKTCASQFGTPFSAKKKNKRIDQFLKQNKKYRNAKKGDYTQKEKIETHKKKLLTKFQF